MNATTSTVSSAVFPRFVSRKINWSRVTLLASLISPLLLLAAWTLATRAHWFSDQILVPPQAVLDAFRELWDSGELPDALKISLYRLLLGFGVGGLAGVALGVLLATSRQAEIYLGPTFQVLRQVPTLALTPMFILLFGIGETLKIVIILKSTIYPVAIATLEGVRGIPREYIEVGRAYRLRPWTRFRRVIFPATVPPVLTGVRIALGRSWMVLVAVELLAADTGIGQMMQIGRQMLRLDIVMVGVIVTGAIGFGFDRGLRVLERTLLPWKYR
ncbi:MAG: sulfonate transport system permease protein [Gammaproteobacteria bacterium]|nr:sulfonate transport system permease protein [Gammaproteobacteria bacterium]